MSLIRYLEKIPSGEQYVDLFLTTGWNQEYRFTAEELEKAIGNSWYAVSAYDQDMLVGFGRVISDGVHHALIVDLMVHPDFQERGIGKTILEMLTKRCLSVNIRDIQLFSAKNKSSFYEKAGYKARPDEAPGMELRKPR